MKPEQSNFNTIHVSHTCTLVAHLIFVVLYSFTFFTGSKPFIEQKGFQNPFGSNEIHLFTSPLFTFSAALVI